MESGIGRFCCRSPKLPGANFLAVKKSDRRPPIDLAPITLPRLPASLSSGNEVPHIFTRKSRVQPKEILITSAKRLLQHYRHTASIRCGAKVRTRSEQSGHAESVGSGLIRRKLPPADIGRTRFADGRSWKCPADRSLALDICCFENRPPLLNLGLVVNIKRLRVLILARRDFLAEVGEPFAHVGIGQGVHDGGIELCDNLLRCALGRPERMPNRN